MILKTKFIYIFFFSVIFIFANAKAQQLPAPATPVQGSNMSPNSVVSAPNQNIGGINDDKPQFEEVDEGGGNTVKLLNGLPNKRRIKRQINLVQGVKHDEEFQIPEVPLTYKGNTELVDMQRIKGTDIFRLYASKNGNGIVTVHNKKTGQILLELQIDVRDQKIEKALREIQALLADIEGIEYKIVNDKILLDGFVLLPKDLKRIGNVISQYADGSGGGLVTSLVTLSPLARKKIVEYIARDVNNPEISISAVGDYIKLEGFVNSDEEKKRVSEIVSLYMPDVVVEKGSEALRNLAISDRKPAGSVDSYIINLIQVRKNEDRVEPPPKMIQVVIHVVEYSDRYLKNFSFMFSPSLRGVGDSALTQRAPTTIGEIANIIDNLMPKLNWARNHGYIRVLDSASVLTQDKKPASINRSITINNGNTQAGAVQQTATPQQTGVVAQPGQVAGTTGTTGVVPSTQQTQVGASSGAQGPSYNLSLNTTPAIKSERSGLIELPLSVSTSNSGLSMNPTTSVNTTVSVRDRQSAALAGIISKKSENQYGGPTGAGAYITLNHGKGFQKQTSNYVLFVTPIIKSSASAGVEQIKKKFRMKE